MVQEGLMRTACCYEEHCLETWDLISRRSVASSSCQPHVSGRKKWLPAWLPGTGSFVYHCCCTSSETHAQWCIRANRKTVRTLKNESMGGGGGGGPQNCSFRWVCFLCSETKFKISSVGNGKLLTDFKLQTICHYLCSRTVTLSSV